MKILTYYLPQFYITPENEKYWGKGFTDWVNVRSARPLFYGHQQPIKPLNDDYYDLSSYHTLQTHSDLSIKYGIDGFGYWHYWFGNGFKTLEKVQEFHLKHRSIKQNYFFAWANSDWTKSWRGDDKTVIFKQEYSEKSAFEHFKYLKCFFEDDRYIRINKRPIFQVLNPDVDGVEKYIRILENQAKLTFGLGVHWLFPADKDISRLGNLVYSRVGFPPGDITTKILKFKIQRFLQKRKIIHKPIIISKSDYLKAFHKEIIKTGKKSNYYPCLLAGWDNTPRYRNKGFLIDSDITTLLEEQFNVLNTTLKNKNINLLFVKAWNEWAEGNILEPYKANHHKYNPLEIIKAIKEKWNE